MQLSIETNPTRALAGMKADSGPCDILTGVLETVAGAAAGRLLCDGAAEGGVKLPTETADIGRAYGFAMYDLTREPGVWAEGDAVPCLRSGRVWASTNGTLARGATAYCVHTGADAGLLRNDTTSATVLPGVRVLAGVTGAGLVLLDVNLTAGATGPTGPTGPTEAPRAPDLGRVSP